MLLIKGKTLLRFGDIQFGPFMCCNFDDVVINELIVSN